MLHKRTVSFLLLVLLGGFAQAASAAYYGQCAFKSIATNKFCRSSSGNGHMITTRNGIGSSEIYRIANAGLGNVTIYDVAAGKFLQVPTGSASVVATAISGASNAAKFVQTGLGSGVYAFKSVGNGQYLRVANDGVNFAWYANGGTTVDSDYERFRIAPCQVDVWQALTAFAANYPNKVKEKSTLNPPGNIKLTSEMASGGYHYWYWIIEDYSHDPLGHPGYDRNQLCYINDWEVWICTGTLPQYIVGSNWQQGIPRTRRYCDPTIQEDSPKQWVDWYNINMDCSQTLATGDNNWGRRYPAWMQDLSSGRGNSQVNMGTRWVMRTAYDTFEESWIVDLGPAVGVFAPKYGTVGYRNSAGVNLWFNNIQDAHSINPKRCSAF